MSHLGVNLFIGEETGEGGEIQTEREGGGELRLLKPFGALLAPVAVEEDFSFSFAANTSLLFLLWFKVSTETSQTA